ncbi:MAG: trypsin-like peptidase domain-containing protein [Planctomycetes bacterium]|nr:trypsin-like peptidase domain-containing protein [Planctomycetota bacterium]
MTLRREACVVLGLLLFLLGPARDLRAQELDPARLRVLKDATAFVRVEGPYFLARGTAFLVEKRGATAYFLTLASGVLGSTKMTLVLKSGTSDQQVVSAAVVALDPGGKLACLAVEGAASLPHPLELKERTEVVETSPVFVAGYPFAEALSAKAQNPEVTIEAGFVQALRHNDRDQLSLIQLGGDVNPGMGGGPLLDAKGALTGMVLGKLEGSQTAFALPVEALRAFLRPHCSSVKLDSVGESLTSSKLGLSATIVDPKRRIRSVDAGWIRRDSLGALPQVGRDGTWSAVSTSLKVNRLEVYSDNSSVHGVWPVERAAADPKTLTFVVQIRITEVDGGTAWMEPATVEVTFQDIPGAMNQVVVQSQLVSMERAVRARDWRTANAFAKSLAKLGKIAYPALEAARQKWSNPLWHEFLDYVKGGPPPRIPK